MNFSYLRQQASNWVSQFVLLGCVIITILLVYTAVKAKSLGDKLTPKVYNIEASQEL